MAVSELHYDGHDLEALFELRNYQKWIADRFRPYLRGEAVEFGAGIGAMSRWFVPMVDRIELVEPSENLVARLTERFAGDGGVTVVSKSLEQYVAGRADASLDAALLVNLLEHIDDDLAALVEIRRILRPDGHLLIFVLALQGL
jgi:SAM-dependent methyltransferase